MSKCNKCNATNSDDATYCSKCGAKLPVKEAPKIETKTSFFYTINYAVLSLII